MPFVLFRCISCSRELAIWTCPWVRRFIVEHCRSKGLILRHVKSTQRDESLNRVIAEDTSPSSRLIDTFESLYERQRLRFFDLRSKLIREVKTAIVVPLDVHQDFQNALQLPTKYVAAKLLDEIRQVNSYVTSGPISKENSIVFQVSRQLMEPKFHTQQEDGGIVANFKRTFRKGERLVHAHADEENLLVLQCSCLLTTTAGYPCRHILFIYQQQLGLGNKGVYKHISHYIDSYWNKRTLLKRYVSFRIFFLSSTNP